MLATAPVLERDEDKHIARARIRQRQASVAEHELRGTGDVADRNVVAVNLVVDDVLPLIGGDPDWKAHIAHISSRTRDNPAGHRNRDTHHAATVGARTGGFRQRRAMDELGWIVLTAARKIVDDSLASAD